MDVDNMKMDKYDISRLIKKKTEATSSISVGITWMDGRLFLKHSKIQSKGVYGICHFSRGVWAITPLDYHRPTGMTEIKASPTENYCSKAFVCLNLNCSLNQFNRAMFIAEFKDCGAFSLGLPSPFQGMWCNEGKWKDFWKNYMIEPEGGTLKYDEEKGKKLGIGE
ncbi:MAG: hypothetical protein ACXADH_10320 [Candidatus Kariarchaeaceae archaeon]|jgi:hypothetical protein